MDLLSVIRRWRFRQGMPIRESVQSYRIVAEHDPQVFTCRHIRTGIQGLCSAE